MYAFLADVVTTVHLGIVAFMVGGLVLVLVGWPLKWRWIRNPWFRYAHLAVMAYIVVNTLVDELCFLTDLEHWLRGQAGQAYGQSTSFIGKLMQDWLFVDATLEELEPLYLGFGALVVIATVFVRPRSFRRSGRASHDEVATEDS